MPNIENQNTKDIRYVDEKIDTLKSEVNKSITKQAVATSKLEGEVRVLESDLKLSTSKLENKIDKVQNDLNKNFNELTSAIIKLEMSQQTTAQAIVEIKDVLQENSAMRNDIQLLQVEVTGIKENVQNQQRNEADIKKEKVKGRFSLAVAIASGILAVLGTLLGLLLK